MTREALVQRELKRSRLAAKYAPKREALRAILKDTSATEEDKFQAGIALQKLPKNALPVRHRNRCALTGRPRGTFRKFGIARNKLRELALKGDIPGVVKASW